MAMPAGETLLDPPSSAPSLYPLSLLRASGIPRIPCPPRESSDRASSRRTLARSGPWWAPPRSGSLQVWGALGGAGGGLPGRPPGLSHGPGRVLVPGREPRRPPRAPRAVRRRACGERRTRSIAAKYRGKATAFVLFGRICHGTPSGFVAFEGSCPHSVAMVKQGRGRRR